LTKSVKQTIGVLGATGTVGSQLLKILGELDIIIFAYVRNFNKLDLRSSNIQPYLFDFEKPSSYLFSNIQKLFWLTPNHLENFQEHTWLEVLKNSGVEHIVQLSSMQPDIFNLTKYEHLIQQSDIPYTILRPNTFMQNFNNYELKSIQNEQALYFPAGSGKTIFIDVRDIARAAAKILISDNHMNKIYTLTGPEALDYYQVANLLSNACNKRIRYIDTWAFPEFETADNKNNSVRQTFFKGVRNNLFSEFTEDLEAIFGQKPISFAEYANDYWCKL
jgi:uncharacterized protein YbjT (DUF2867 family)